MEKIGRIERYPSDWTEKDIEEYQMEWIQEHTDAYDRYCEDIIIDRWEDEQLPRVEEKIDDIISELTEE